MRYLWILSLALFVGCHDTPTTSGDVTTTPDVTDTQVADATSDADAPCWWCTDASGDVDVPDLTKDTTGKPGKDPGGEKEYIVWAGNIDLEAGQGTYMYDHQMAGLKCTITYTVTAVTAVEGCDACEFAWSLSLGDIEASEQMEKCTDGMGKEGTTVHYGQSSEGTNDKGTGSPLLADLGDGWVPVGNRRCPTGWRQWHDRYAAVNNPLGWRRYRAVFGRATLLPPFGHAGGLLSGLTGSRQFEIRQCASRNS